MATSVDQPDYNGQQMAGSVEKCRLEEQMLRLELEKTEAEVKKLRWPLYLQAAFWFGVAGLLSTLGQGFVTRAELANTRTAERSPSSTSGCSPHSRRWPKPRRKSATLILRRLQANSAGLPDDAHASGPVIFVRRKVFFPMHDAGQIAASKTRVTSAT